MSISRLWRLLNFPYMHSFITHIIVLLHLPFSIICLLLDKLRAGPETLQYSKQRRFWIVFENREEINSTHSRARSCNSVLWVCQTLNAA